MDTWDANEKQTNNASICIRYTFDACFHFSTAMRTVSRMKQYTQVCTLEIPSRFQCRLNCVLAATERVGQQDG